MEIKKYLAKIDKYKDKISGWVSFIFLLLPVIIKIFSWLIKSRSSFLLFIDEYSLTFLIISIFAALAYFYFEMQKIKTRMKIGFIEKLKSDLHERWDFKGDWKIENNELSVSDSDEGGITKNGSLWENYEFEFETKIVNKFSGWIVRAEDLNNYFMFQINFENIRPHLRLSQPTIKNKDGSLEITKINVGWKLFGDFPHQKDLKDKWFKIKTIVKGSRVDIFVNNDNVFHLDTFLTIPMGKVGFREWGDEHAHFKNIKVTMID